ncbi:hypothetical protein O3P69_008758 [Scylla paramamosain]|uniref:Uncharacterized protein n=1 Tax=Scylla paramamosain TaxID=85552 RepID=A0AAW0SMQ0_SCYPA
MEEGEGTDEGKGGGRCSRQRRDYHTTPLVAVARLLKCIVQGKKERGCPVHLDPSGFCFEPPSSSHPAVKPLVTQGLIAARLARARNRSGARGYWVFGGRGQLGNPLRHPDSAPEHRRPAHIRQPPHTPARRHPVPRTVGKDTLRPIKNLQPCGNTSLYPDLH